MQNYPSTTTGDSGSSASAASGEGFEGGARVKHKVPDMGRSVADQIDDGIGAAASGLEKAAAGLHERAENLPGVEQAEALAHGAAEKLTSTADYLRSQNVDRLLGDFKVLITKHPGPALLTVGVIGFWLGRTLVGGRS